MTSRGNAQVAKDPDAPFGSVPAEKIQATYQAEGASKASSTWHIITCEYPPRSGGVSDYSYLVAQGLAVAGDQVHVWCPGPGQTAQQGGVMVHATLGGFAPGDLKTAGRELDQFAGPRHLLVQWVPHGYGYKSLNLGFCLWLWRRATKGDRVDLVIHEPFLPFKKGRWRQNAAAILHRVMMIVILRTAWRVWLSTPAWEQMIRPFSLGRQHAYNWLPLPSNVPAVDDPAAALAIHQQYAAKGLLIGHFGTFGTPITPLLEASVPALLHQRNDASMIFIGPGSIAFRDGLSKEHPGLANRLHAIGPLDARDARLSAHISACDAMLQPFPDGVQPAYIRDGRTFPRAPYHHHFGAAYGSVLAEKWSGFSRASRRYRRLGGVG